MHVERDRRLVHDPRVFSPQPVGEKSGRLVHPVDPRTRHRVVRPVMDPWPYPEFLRDLQMRVGSEHGVRVTITPAGHQENRALNAVIPRTERAVAPVRPVHLMLHPIQEIGLVLLQPLLPHFRPFRSDPLRSRR